MELWDEKKMREQWAANEAIDDFVRRVQAWGHKQHMESFALAEQVCKSYERQTATMTEVQRYDFRRAFELGYRFAMLKHDPSNAAHDGWRIRRTVDGIVGRGLEGE